MNQTVIDTAAENTLTTFPQPRQGGSLERDSRTPAAALVPTSETAPETRTLRGSLLRRLGFGAPTPDEIQRLARRRPVRRDGYADPLLAHAPWFMGLK